MNTEVTMNQTSPHTNPANPDQNAPRVDTHSAPGVHAAPATKSSSQTAEAGNTPLIQKLDILAPATDSGEATSCGVDGCC